jgi:uncharacterized protein YndB with AHSA1/START domain
MKNTGTLKVTTQGDNEIVLTRVFDAPKRLVYDAFTKPELLKRWFGPHGHHLVVCDVDLTVGGKWRFVIRDPEGREMGMYGTWVELDPPDRIVHTEAFDMYPGDSRITTVFTEKDGKTTMVATCRYPSLEVRDAVIASGMEHGAAESYDRLNDLLAQR